METGTRQHTETLSELDIMDFCKKSDIIELKHTGGIKIKFGVAMSTTQPLQDKANPTTKRSDTRSALSPPHITLKESFETDKYNKEKIIEYLKNVAKNHNPVDIEIKKVSSFVPNSQ